MCDANTATCYSIGAMSCWVAQGDMTEDESMRVTVGNAATSFAVLRGQSREKVGILIRYCLSPTAGGGEGGGGDVGSDQSTSNSKRRPHSPAVTMHLPGPLLHHSPSAWSALYSTVLPSIAMLLPILSPGRHPAAGSGPRYERLPIVARG